MPQIRDVFSVSVEPVSPQFFEPGKLERCSGASCEVHGHNFAETIQVSARQKLKAYLFLVNAFDLAVSRQDYDAVKRIWKDLSRYTDDDVKALEALLE
jgi:hypothetical protein